MVATDPSPLKHRTSSAAGPRRVVTTRPSAPMPVPRAHSRRASSGQSQSWAGSATKSCCQKARFRACHGSDWVADIRSVMRRVPSAVAAGLPVLRM